MTSSTSAGDVRFMETRATATQFGGSGTLLLATLLAFQCASAAQIKAGEVMPNSSLQLTRAVPTTLFDDLLNFHQQLTSSQQDLPEEAARLLRENLWSLYD